jgi:hypothetical protein
MSERTLFIIRLLAAIFGLLCVWLPERIHSTEPATAAHLVDVEVQAYV